MTKREFIYNDENYKIIIASIETTINELYDFNDALDNAKIKDGKSDAFLKTAKSYEELRKAVISKNITDFHISQIDAILSHRLTIFEKKEQDIIKACIDMEKFINDWKSSE